MQCQITPVRRGIDCIHEQVAEHLSKLLRVNGAARRRNGACPMQQQRAAFETPALTCEKASKSIWGMPGRQVPKKDVVHCEKFR